MGYREQLCEKKRKEGTSKKRKARQNLLSTKNHKRGGGRELSTIWRSGAENPKKRGW